MGKFLRAWHPNILFWEKYNFVYNFITLTESQDSIVPYNSVSFISFLVIHSVEGEKHENNKSEKQSPKQDRYINCRGGISFPPSANTTMRTICSPVDFKQR